MIDPAVQIQLKEAIADCIGTDQGVLDALREEVHPLRQAMRQIRPRATTSISLVGTDGGNNQLQFDPFLIQLVRIVDSSNNEYCLEAVSPTTPIEKLNKRQFDSNGVPSTALGKMMAFLGVNSLPALSHTIRPTVYYTNRDHRVHSNPEAFAADWRQVWRGTQQMYALEAPPRSFAAVALRIDALTPSIS
jgi:hypothetical protein